MKINFFFNRDFEIKDCPSLLRQLLINDHHVNVYIRKYYKIKKNSQNTKIHGTNELYDEFSTYKNFSCNQIKFKSFNFIIALRTFLTFLEYINRGSDFTQLKKRWIKKHYLLGFFDSINYLFKSNFIFKFFQFFINKIEYLFVDRNILTVMRSDNPDAIILCSLLNDTTLTLNEIIKCAKKSNIKVYYIVRSWDNLTNKAYMNIKPDCFFIWNKFQLEELKIFQRSTKENKIITGALLYEHLLNKKYLLDEKHFRSIASLDDKPIITYLGSSSQIIENEFFFIYEFLEKLSKRKLFCNFNFIIRLHPLSLERVIKNGKLDKNIQSLIFKLTKFKNISFLPNIENFNKEIHDKSIYLSNIFYSYSLIGLNTSAMIESVFFSKNLYIPKINEDYEKKLTESLFTNTFHFKYLNNGNNRTSIAKTINDIDDIFMDNTNLDLLNNFKANFLNLDNYPSQKIIDYLENKHA